ncbi:MAG: hypothetical protein MK538_13445, partial [Planctomycetes bacterium]|nr:hypothetical protein [Planctomycetota bacterium]
MRAVRALGLLFEHLGRSCFRDSIECGFRLFAGRLGVKLTRLGSAWMDFCGDDVGRLSLGVVV